MIFFLLTIYLTAAVTRICDGNDAADSWGWPISAFKAVKNYFENK